MSVAAHRYLAGGHQLPWLSRISCCRMGILSMDAEISRTFQGKGLRKYGLPSLPITTSIKPRGRSCSRSGDGGGISVYKHHNIAFYKFVAERVDQVHLLYKARITVCVGEDYNRPVEPEKIAEFHLGGGLDQVLCWGLFGGQNRRRNSG
jgi:hypothetical protein